MWIRHRKLCKKRASAKWYLKKKQREIREQNDLRRELEREYQIRCQRPMWSPEEMAHHRCFLAHHLYGYPRRPDEVPVFVWDAWKDHTEQRLERLETTFPHWRWSVPLRVSLRRLTMREYYEEYYQSPPTDDALKRFRRTRGWGPGVLMGPLGYVWSRLQSVAYARSDWCRWIQAIQATYPVTTRNSIHPNNPIHTRGINRMPTTSPVEKQNIPYEASHPSDDTWLDRPVVWDRLVTEFEDWLHTQAATPEDSTPSGSDHDHDTASLTDSQDSLDSSLLQDIFGLKDSDPPHDHDHSASESDGPSGDDPTPPGVWTHQPYARAPDVGFHTASW